MLNPSTVSKTIWDQIHKISWKQLSTPLEHLLNSTKSTAWNDITNLSAETFSKNSSIQQFIKIVV